MLHVKKGPKSFEDLRTINGIIYPTFLKAAQVLGLFKSDDYFVRAMTEANMEKMSLLRLQHYFAMLLVYQTPSDPQQMFDRFLDNLYPPIAANTFNVEEIEQSNNQRRGKVLKNLEYFLNCMNSCLRYHFGY